MMRTTDSISGLRAIRASMEGTFGLIPTMGALHEGHCSLVAKARSECKHIGVSIFVNPSQFGPGEDFAKYPRTLQRDLDMLEKLGVDVVWTPDEEAMYPAGFQTWVTVEELSVPLEGRYREGHFRGVTTIVTKLLHCFLPDRAYFGQKDAQQVVVLRRMVQDLNFPVEMVVCPTIRDPDGLALSSRNAYLSAPERRAATVLFRALNAAKQKYDGGERNADILRAAMRSLIRSEPLACEQYVSAADPDTLRELTTIEEHALLSLAVLIGKTRLIDNFLL
jgi:pantoate--beta-alanine ligase